MLYFLSYSIVKLFASKYQYLLYNQLEASWLGRWVGRREDGTCRIYSATALEPSIARVSTFSKRSVESFESI
jgi:hypothetical protein